MKKLLVSISVLLCAGLLFAGGSSESEQRDSMIFDYDDFSEVTISSAITVEFTQSDRYYVEAEASESVLEKYLVVKEQGNELSIYLKPGLRMRSINVKVFIAAPEFTGIELSGASTGVLSDYYSNGSLDISLSGASDFSFDGKVRDILCSGSGASTIDMSEIISESMYIDFSGAGDITCSGKVKYLDLILSGASSGKLGDLRILDGIVELSGASHADMNISGLIEGVLSGASSINYIGGGEEGDIELSGASSIKKM